jgi:hypothetical protein
MGDLLGDTLEMGNPQELLGRDPRTFSPKAPSTHYKLLFIGTLLLLIVGSGGAAILASYISSETQLSGTQVETYKDELTFYKNIYPCFEEGTFKKKPYAWLPKKTIDIFYIWDSAPDSLQSTIETVPNLGTIWPPDLGSKYRLAAYPFPASHGNVFFVNLIYGLSGMVNSTNDSKTFPAWFINIYDPLNWRKNNPYLDEKTLNDTSLETRSTFYRSYQFIEIQHACYGVPPTYYPVCDDGGYWLYHAKGSGVFWNTGKSCCRINKIDAGVFLTAQMIQTIAKLKSTDSTDTKLFDLYKGFYGHEPPSPKSGGEWKGVWGQAVEEVAALLDAKKGDSDVFAAVKGLISDFLKTDTKKQGNVIVFRGFKREPQAKRSFIILGVLVGLCVALVGVAVWSLGTGVLGHTSLFIPPVSLVLACSMLGLAWFYQLRKVFEGIGWTTFAGAMSKTGMSAKAAVESVCGMTDGENDSDRIMSGLSMTWFMDPALELFSHALGYDSVIMSTQPNKQGVYTTEIVDVTKNGKIGEEWKGGICGGNGFSDRCKPDTPTTPAAGVCLGFYTFKNPNVCFDTNTTINHLISSYGGTKCTCEESSTASCVSCGPFISAKLCAPNAKTIPSPVC